MFFFLLSYSTFSYVIAIFCCFLIFFNTCYTPIIYAKGYIVFVFPFVCSFVIPLQ